jgi:hypothetical protein
MWLIEPVKIVIFWALIFLLRPNFCCQGYRYVPSPGPQGQVLPARYDANKLTNMEDVLEYQSLLHSCKMIKQNMKIIADYRLRIEDAVETSITLYLQGVKGDVAKILLQDIRNNGFQL